MNLKHDNVFYRIFSSLRYDWTIGVDERADWMLEILPYTSVFDKEKMKRNLLAMKKSFLESIEDEEHYFDGRSWSKGWLFSYLTPEEWIKINDIDLRPHGPDKPEWYGPKLDDDDTNCHEDVEVLYEAWLETNKNE